MYDTDVTEAEWRLIQAYFQSADKRGAKARQAGHRKRHFLLEQGGLSLAVVT